MTPVLLIGLGGFAGTIARYLVGTRVSAWTGGTLPWGTFAVNVTGSFALGFVFVLFVERATGSAEVRGPLMVGFIGAYTTFSTLALKSWRLVEGGLWLYAVVNLAGSVALGLLALVAGIALGRAL
jgi:CrcB protein